MNSFLEEQMDKVSSRKEQEQTIHKLRKTGMGAPFDKEPLAICGDNEARLVSCWSEEVTCPHCIELERKVPRLDKAIGRVATGALCEEVSK